MLAGTPESTKDSGMEPEPEPERCLSESTLCGPLGFVFEYRGVEY